MEFLGSTVLPLGMGCWPIGGAMYSGDQPLGYTNVNDAESIRTIHAALASGVEVFDTAPAYGAGHAEKVLGRALVSHPDALVVTKVGVTIDERTRQLTGDETHPDSVMPAIEASLTRLRRDHIDLLLLHQGAWSVAQALPFFDAMDAARDAGKIRAYGWSTDFAASTRAMAGRDGFAAVEHAMNVLLDVPRMHDAVRDTGLAALIRSPLAMGLLGGKYDAGSVMPADDIRATSNPKTDYFRNGRINPRFAARLDAVRELLTSGGRSLAQGALGWLWARSPRNLPIPGARTVAQIEGIAGAVDAGPLPVAVMAEIEAVIDRQTGDDEDRAR